jgi:glycosyltransferase involved in cell wall biosynthesis
MHILFLSDNFPPEVNAPASRTFEHCREWVAEGYQVTVITCVPNFPKGKVFDGYNNKLIQKEIIEGINVIRVWSYITANEGTLKRMGDYMSYMVTSFLAGLRVKHVSVIVGTSPQFFTVCSAYALSIFKRVPWIFELRDLWPESIKAVGAMKDSALLDFFEKLELFLYRKANYIITVTHSFKKNLIERNIDRNKISVITNGVDMTRFMSMPKDENLLNSLGLNGKFIAGYIGTHGLAHGLETLIEAAMILQAEAASFLNAKVAINDSLYSEKNFFNNIHFIFLGEGAKKSELKEKAAALNLKNVLFLDSVSKNEVVRYWSILDISIIHLKKTELFTTVIPSKLFECMGMGIPVLHGVRGESSDIVLQERIGEVFEPENAQELVDGIIKLKNDNDLYLQYKKNALNAAKKYDRKYLALEMAKVIFS